MEKFKEEFPLSLQAKRGQDKSFIFLISCLILGLSFIIFLLRQDYFIPHDGCFYALSGKNFVSGQGLTAWGKPSLWFPPFYPLIIGIFHKFIGNLVLAGRLVSIVCFFLSIIFFFKLAKLIYNKSVACFATLLFVTNQYILDYSHQVLNHSLDVLLIIIAIYLASLIIKSERLKYKNFIFLGIILASAILNRSENIILSLAIIIILFIQGKEQILRKIIVFFCSLIILIALTSPYVIFLHKHTGRWTLTGKIPALQFFEYQSSKNPLARVKQKEVSPSEFRPFEYIRKNKEELLKRYGRGIILFSQRLNVILYGGLGYILISLGLFAQSWSKERKKIEILLFFSLSPLAVLPLGNVLYRYFLFALPIFLLWAAKGLENLFIFIKNSFKSSNTKLRLLICLVLILLFLPMVRFAIIREITPKELLSIEHKQMGLWMKDNIEDIENKKVAFKEAQIAFYSGAQYFEMPFEEDYLSSLNHLRREGVDYLIIDQKIVPFCFPHQFFLIDEQRKHRGLTKVHLIKEPQKIILYQVN